MVNAIQRSVPVHPPSSETIPSWNHCLLAETPSRRNLFPRNWQWIAGWNRPQADAQWHACCRTLSRTITFDRMRYVFNTCCVVTSRFVTAVFVLKPSNGVASCSHEWPFFCQLSMGADTNSNAIRYQNPGCHRGGALFGSIQGLGDAQRGEITNSAIVSIRVGDR